MILGNANNGFPQFGINGLHRNVSKTRFRHVLKIELAGTFDELMEVNRLVRGLKEIVKQICVIRPTNSLQLLLKKLPVDLVLQRRVVRRELKNSPCFTCSLRRMIESVTAETHQLSNGLTHSPARISVVADVGDAPWSKPLVANTENVILRVPIDPRIRSMADDVVESPEVIANFAQIHAAKFDIVGLQIRLRRAGSVNLTG